MNNFIELLDQLVNIDSQPLIKEIDLTKKEDYEYLVNTINELKENPLFSVLGSLFGLDNEDLDKILEKMESIQKELVKKEINEDCDKILEKIENIQKGSVKTEKVEEKKPIQKVVIDKSIEEEPKKTIERPSQKIDVNAGLQIHKLVQEYIDTMIKPYNPKVGGLTTEQVNDAYAGLYEFACWIYNKN